MYNRSSGFVTGGRSVSWVVACQWNRIDGATKYELELYDNNPFVLGGMGKLLGTFETDGNDPTMSDDTYAAYRLVDEERAPLTLEEAQALGETLDAKYEKAYVRYRAIEF